LPYTEHPERLAYHRTWRPGIAGQEVGIMGSKGRKLRQYSDQEREEAIALAEMVGNGEAGRTLDMPPGTIGTWRTAYRKRVKTSGPVVRIEEADEGTRVNVKVRASRLSPSSPQAKAEAPQVEAPADTSRKPRVEVNTGKPKKRVARVYTPSQRAQALEMMRDKGPVETSRKLGISTGNAI
jgi:transposase-like protein